MKNIIKFCLAKIVLISFVVFSFSSLVYADTTAGMYVDCYNVSGTSPKLTPGAIEQPVLWIAVGNMKPSGGLPVTKIGLKFSGTVAGADIVSAHFTTLNNAGTLIDLGTAAFNPVTKRAELNGAPLFNIPNGWTRDITVKVNVAPGAAVGGNVTFSIDVNNFDYTTSTPPVLIDGNFSCSSSTLAIEPISPPTSSTLSITQPNGGEIWSKGGRYSIKWNSINRPTGAYFCKVDLFKAGAFLQNLRTMSVGYIAQGIVWTIPTTLATANNYKIRAYMCDTNGNTIMQDTSDANFRIQ